MKIVINKCFGGFSLSPLAVEQIAARKGRECYFFKQDISAGLDSDYLPMSLDEATERSLFFSAFSVPNPNEILERESNWHAMTMDERKAQSAIYESIEVSSRDYERNDPDLIAVVEELGDAANGRCAKLGIVEIPDGTDFVIEEYDGLEHIAEAHRTWS